MLDIWISLMFLYIKSPTWSYTIKEKQNAMYKIIMKIHGLQNKIKTIMFCHDSFKLEGNPVELASRVFILRVFWELYIYTSNPYK
jgi:hypothetical protein